MFLATTPRRGLSAARPCFSVCSHSSMWQLAQSTFLSGCAVFLAWTLPFSALSLMSVWQVTHCIIECTL